MTTSLEYFRLVATEFSASSDVQVNAFIDLAGNFINSSLYANPELALAYQAASLMYMQKQSTNGDSSGLYVTMEKEGDLQRQYASGSKSGSVTKDIYLQMLDTLSRSITGATIMTRFGYDIPNY